MDNRDSPPVIKFGETGSAGIVPAKSGPPFVQLILSGQKGRRSARPQLKSVTEQVTQAS